MEQNRTKQKASHRFGTRWDWGQLKQATLLLWVMVVSGALGEAFQCKNAEARAKTGSPKAKESPLVYRQAAPESASPSHGHSNGIKSWGLGFSTVSAALPGGSAALTAIVNLNSKEALQGIFSLPATSPFNLGVLMFYKRTVHQSRGAGFHLGAGLGLASVNDGTTGSAFSLNLNGVAGFHFELPGISNVLVHLDGGPSLNVISTNPTFTDFRFSALSPALGASVVYLF